MDNFLVYLKEHGVLAVGEEKPYGLDVRYFLDGIEFETTCEPDEYVVLGYIESL